MLGRQALLLCKPFSFDLNSQGKDASLQNNMRWQLEFVKPSLDLLSSANVQGVGSRLLFVTYGGQFKVKHLLHRLMLLLFRLLFSCIFSVVVLFIYFYCFWLFWTVHALGTDTFYFCFRGFAYILTVCNVCILSFSINFLYFLEKELKT